MSAHNTRPGLRWLPFTLIAILALLLAACGASETAQAPAAPAAADATTAPVAGEEHADEEHAGEEHAGDEHAGEEHAGEEHAGEEHAGDEHTHPEVAGGTIAALGALPAGARPNVVATTTIVGDVVRQIGGDNIDLQVLLPLDADPHSFEPAPQDIALVAAADLVLINGLGLEEFLAPLIENSGIDPNRVIAVSDGIDTRDFAAGAEHAEEHADEEHAGEEHADEHAGEEHADEHASAEHEHSHSGADPHVWFSPLNIMVWSDNVAAALSALDPANAATYTANAERYNAELAELDMFIQAQIEQIPAENRELVTDHRAFGYFADRYGLTQVGAVIPAYSTLAEPSAQEMAALQTAITEYAVPAIFVGTTVNPRMAEQVANDTGIRLVPLYTGSLSASDGPAATYLDLMRYNTEMIVNGLSGQG